MSTEVQNSSPTGDRHRAPLLEIVDLKTWFDTPRGVVKAVDGVTFTLHRGRTIGIVGESGSGKTVMARSVLNLLPKRSTIAAGGKVLFDGVDLRPLNARRMRDYWGEEIALVPQDPMTSLNPVVKLGRQLTEHLCHHLKMGRKEANETAQTLLRSLGIPEPRRRLRQYPHELSGGMRQRVAIAIALACGPKLIVADEPTTALDVTIQAQILDLLKRQQIERHTAMMLITHDLGVVAGRTDDILVMYAGRAVEKGPTPLLFGRTRHPYTEALLNSIPRIEATPHTRHKVIPGRPPNLVDLPNGCRFAPRCRYAQPRCLQEDPPLMSGGDPGHEYACFFPVGTPAGEEALQRNRDARRTAVGTPVDLTIAEAAA